MSLPDLIEFSSTLIGLTADPATFRTEYIALIAPGETPERAATMAKESGCGLVMRGVLRRFIQHPLLDAPYRDTHALSDLMTIATQAHAHRSIRAAPNAGNIVIVATDDEKVWHTWICIDADGGDLVAIDGGQVVDGYQAVTRRAHRVSEGRDVTATYNRRVRAVIDCGVVVARLGREA